MKKKTVITTEKHEVWVIHSPAGQLNEQQKPIESELKRESLSVSNSERPDSDLPDDEQK